MEPELHRWTAALESASEVPATLIATLLAIADDAIVVVDDAQRIVLFNQGAERIFGWQTSEIVGKPLALLLPGGTEERHARHMAGFASSGRSARRMGERGEVQGRRASGEVFPAEASIAHVSVGGRRYFAAIVRDVTERKAADAALRRSEARFRALAESSPVGIFETDARGEWTYANRCWCEMAGLRPEEAMGGGWARAVHPEDRARVHREWAAAVAAVRNFASEFRLLRPDGRQTWVFANAVPAPSQGNTLGYIGTIADVTERRAQAAALEKARQEAEAAALAKSLFLANMSHEIRTPLNAVIGMTSLLLETPISEEQKDFAQTIRASGEALLSIINDILDYSKIDLGRLELERQPFDLRRTVEDALDLLAPSAAEKGLNLAYFIGESTPGTLIGDVTRLRQILVNLVSNAVKFTHHGEVVVSVECETLEAGSHRIHFAVKDTGIGIAKERMPHLFQSFTQVDPATTRKYGGTGLGLAISKRLAELMGGTAWAESEPGVGSTFHFTIVAEAGPEADHHYLRQNPPVLAGKRMLIVDDNITNRRILVKQALLWGMLPSASPSAQEALDLVRHGPAFDVAILDLGMPDMDGLDLAWEIRRYKGPKELPIIVLTSMGHRLNLPADEELALAAYLNKPIKPAQLFNVLVAALGKSGGPKGHEGTLAPPEPKLAEGLPLRILVAEDNAINQKVVLRMLERLGYRVDVAANGFEVLDALERQPYDVVLMDIQMPEMDGIEATRRIYQRFDRHEAPRVIAMTANAMPGDREKCLAIGMDGYIVKPIDVDTLRDALMGLDVHAARAAFDRANEALDRRRLEHLASMQDEGHPHLVRDLIDMFIEDSPQHLERLRQALARADAQALCWIAHRLRSSVENLGALRMSSLCDELENLGRTGVLEGAGPVLTSLERELERVSAVLRAERERF